MRVWTAFFALAAAQSAILAAILAAFLAAALPAGVAMAQQAASAASEGRTFLRVEAGRHTAPIRALAVSPDGATVATASDDKTIRVWSAQDGALLDTIRPHIGDGPDGIQQTVAFHWNGDRLLAGGISFGDDGINGLYRIDLVSRQVDRRWERGGNIAQVALGADAAGSRRFVTAQYAGGRGLVHIRDGRNQVVLRDFLDAAPAWVEYTAAGDLIVAVHDGQIRVYRDDALLTAHTLPSGADPAVARVSPDGALIAVGYLNRRQVDVLRLDGFGAVAALVGSDNAAGGGGGGGAQQFNALTWRPVEGATGGGELWAAGSYAHIDTGRAIVRRWRDVADAQTSEDLAVANDVVTALQAMPDGSVAFATTDPSWGVIEADFTLRYAVGPVSGDFRAVWSGLLAVDDAHGRIAFRYDQRGAVNLVFDAATMTLVDAAEAGVFAPDEDGGASRALAPAWRAPRPPEGLEGWRFRAQPTWNGAPLALPDAPIVRAADSGLAAPADGAPAVTPPGGFVLGTDNGLSVFDATGAQIAAVKTATAAYGVLTLADGRLMSLHGDGALRIWRAEADGLAEDATLFVVRGREAEAEARWLAWLADGRFAHSQGGGQRLAGYHINRADDASARWIDFSQIYANNYAPSAVRTALLEGTTALAATGAAPAVVAAEEVAQEAARAPEVRIAEFCPIVDGAERACLPADVATRGLGAIAARKVGVEETYLGGVRALPPGTEAVRLIYEVANIGGVPSRIDVFLNAVLSGGPTRGLGAMAAPTAAAAQPAPTEDDGPLRLSREVTLVDGVNEVALRVYNAEGTFGLSQTVSLHRPATGMEQGLPIMHVVAIGVNDYDPEGEFAPLNFAAADAAAFAVAAQTHASASYSAVRVTDLTAPGAVSRRAVLEALEVVAENAEPQDSVAIYIAGHGLEIDGDYIFVPPEVSLVAELQEGGLRQTDLIAAIGAIRARNRVLLLDTCHAGSFEPPERSAGTMNNESGLAIFAAAASDQEALDGYNGEHGVFGYAVRTGLEGDAVSRRGRVTSGGLGEFLREEVPILASERAFRQTPVIHQGVGAAFILTEPKT